MTIEETVAKINAWIAAGRKNFGHEMHAAARAVEELVSLEANGVYWRGTNRRAELQEVKNGLQVISKNHATGESERGMSVSTTLATVWAYGYKYCYQVTGDHIGYGSDGEPILSNVQVVSPLRDASAAIAKDPDRQHALAQLRHLSTQTGLSIDQLQWLQYR